MRGFIEDKSAVLLAFDLLIMENTTTALSIVFAHCKMICTNINTAYTDQLLDCVLEGFRRKAD